MSERTVKVRIAVAVDSNGVWYAAGSTREAQDGTALGNALRSLESALGLSEVYWVAAEIQIPEPQTVAGTVSPAEQNDG